MSIINLLKTGFNYSVNRTSKTTKKRLHQKMQSSNYKRLGQLYRIWGD